MDLLQRADGDFFLHGGTVTMVSAAPVSACGDCKDFDRNRREPGCLTKKRGGKTPTIAINMGRVS